MYPFEALASSSQDKSAVNAVTSETVKLLGSGQAGGAIHVIAASQPGFGTTVEDTNSNIRLPSAASEV